MKIRILLLLVGLAFVAGCQKEEAAKSKTELLAGNSSKSWKVVSLMGKIGTTEVNIFTVAGLVQDCEKDDLLVFYTNRNFDRKGSTIKCKASDPDVILASTWALSADEKTLSIKNLGDFELLDLTEQTMKYKAPFTYSGITYEVTATLQAQ